MTAMYADDIFIIGTTSSLTQDKKFLHYTVSAVDNWIKKWKLNLNSSKSNSTLFTLSNAELYWKPSIKIGEKIVSQITWCDLWQITVIHDTRWGNSKKWRWAVENTSWGCRKKDLKNVWTAHVRKVLNYNAGVEATVNSMKYVIQNIAKSRESSLFTQDTEFEGVCRSRLKRRAARFEAENLCKELSEHHRAPFEFFTIKTWQKSFGKVSFFPALIGVLKRTTMWTKLK